MTDWDVFEHAGYHYRDDVFGGNRRYANYAFMLSARDLQRVGGSTSIRDAGRTAPS
jgi:hypothetical protein